MIRSARSIKALLQALRSDRAGATIVEFALVAPALLIVLLGGLDFSYRAYVHSLLQGSLNDAARRASVESPDMGGDKSVKIEDRVKEIVKGSTDRVAPSGTLVVTQKNYFDFSGIGNPEKIVKDVGGDGSYDEDDGDCFEDLNDNGTFDIDAGRTGRGAANDVVFYNATLTMDALLPIRSFIGGEDKYVLRATTAVRNQPWQEQAKPPVICGGVK